MKSKILITSHPIFSSVHEFITYLRLCAHYESACVSGLEVAALVLGWLALRKILLQWVRMAACYFSQQHRKSLYEELVSSLSWVLYSFLHSCSDMLYYCDSCSLRCVFIFVFLF